nr:hypothetical protein [Tanacetum cinerariifolium]
MSKSSSLFDNSTQPTANAQPTTELITLTSTVHAEEINTNQAVDAQFVPYDIFNLFCTPIKEVAESSSRNVDNSNMHTFYQRRQCDYRWTKNHPLEQVRGNPSKPVKTRRQLATDPKMCMFALTVSTAKQKNIKEAMANHTWIEAMQEELHQFDKFKVWELVNKPFGKTVRLNFTKFGQGNKHKDDWFWCFPPQRNSTLYVFVELEGELIQKLEGELIQKLDGELIQSLKDIYAAASKNYPPMLNKENYVPWSSHLLRYAKSRTNGKLNYNSIINGSYVRRMIPKLGDQNREVPMNETFHEQTYNELIERNLNRLKSMINPFRLFFLVFLKTSMLLLIVVKLLMKSGYVLNK